jgi:hypothetical protein
MGIIHQIDDVMIIQIMDIELLLDITQLPLSHRQLLIFLYVVHDFDPWLYIGRLICPGGHSIHHQNTDYRIDSTFPVQRKG